MSNCSLIEWFEHFLFGHSTLVKPPSTIYKLILRLEAEGIQWKNVVLEGGITFFRYQIQGDFDVLMEYLDKTLLQHSTSVSLPIFKTRAMTLFFNELLAVLARQQVPQEPILLSDQVILEKILSGESGRFSYVSPSFWGNLAREWLTHRRPIPETKFPTFMPLDRTARLYDITCKARGEMVDPLSMCMVPAKEHVNAVHWQSGPLLESFVRNRPTHSLSQSVQALVKQSIHQLLGGQYPSCLVEKDDTIANFLQNVNMVHEHVGKVSFTKIPPFVIDVFQRLLAMVQMDDLWVTCTEVSVLNSFPKTDMMRLSEQLLLAERQNKIVLTHVDC